MYVTQQGYKAIYLIGRMAGGAHVAAFPEDVIPRLADVVAEHKRIPIPEPVRRTMAIAPR